MASRYPGGYNGSPQDNTNLIDRNPPADRMQPAAGRSGGGGAPSHIDEHMAGLYDSSQQDTAGFSIPDTTGEVDPTSRGHFDEDDFSSHRNFDPNAGEKKRKHKKKKSPRSHTSSMDSDMSSDRPPDRAPPVPSHAAVDIFAEDGGNAASAAAPDNLMVPERRPDEVPQDTMDEREHARLQRNQQQQHQQQQRQYGGYEEPSISKGPSREQAPYFDRIDPQDIASTRRYTGNKRRSKRRSRKGTGDLYKNEEYTNDPSKFDHTPHEVFVELHELENEEMQWREKARWIKFEENVEEGTGRWGKPHVANLSFLQLIELRKYLESGSVLLDIEDQDLSTIYHRIVDNLILSNQVRDEDRGQILQALFYDHLHVQESRGLVSDLMSIRARSRSRTRSTLQAQGRRIMQSKPQQAGGGAGGYDTNDGTNGGNDLTNRDQRDLKNLKHQGDMGVHFSNGHQDTDIRIPIVQTELVDSTAEDSLEMTKGGKKKGKNKQKLSPQNRRPTMERVTDNRNDIMKKIPADAEGVTVLVGEIDCLEKPVLSFVRLAEGTHMDGLTEVPIPVRFIFVLLGPSDQEVDYYEIGRCFSTLMSSENFNETAYIAANMKGILSAMNLFIGETMVLPAGNWNKELLMPVLRKQKRLRQDQGLDDTDSEYDDDEDRDGKKKKDSKPKALANPLERTRRPFGGMCNDIRRRYPLYLSDFKDALSGQCLSAVVFIFFAALAPAITFGGLIGEKTENWMGISEMIVGSSVCGVIFALFAGQPLIIIGVTGPILVFEENLYKFCKSMDIEYLPMRFWTGCWLCLVATICVAAEGSVLVRFISRFTEEIFSFLISLIFIFEVFNKLVQIFYQHPLLTIEGVCSSNNGTVGAVVEQVTDAVVTVGWPGVTDYPMSTVAGGVNGSALCAEKEPPKSDQPNTALLSTILMFGTYLLANQLKVFKNSHYLGKSARKLLADFGIPIAIMVMVGKDLAISTVYTTKLDVPNGLVPTDGCKRGWFVNPMGTEKPFPIMWMAGAVIPALLAFILMFMETLITELIVNKKDNKLQKGGGFHLDLFILGLLAAFNGAFGLPWVWAATVRSVTHLGALTVFSTTHAPGEKPRLESIREQRVTAFLVNLFIGLSIALAPVLKMVPLAVLFGVFLFMGVSSLNGIQFADRVFMMAMPVKHHPDVKYVRNVRTWRRNLYTVIQLGGVAMLWGVKISPAALAFPFFLILLVPIRKVLEKIFTQKELDALDCAEAGEDEVEQAVEVVVPI